MKRERGCGTRKPNAFYIDVDMENDFGKDGQFWSWTWLHGDGIDNVLPLTFPPRSMTVINPAATITTGEIIRDTDEYVPASMDEEILYLNMVRRIARLGVGDHVGSKFYTPASFAKETGLQGPSRRVPEQMAMVLHEIFQNNGPFPILFTHSDIPVFKDEFQRDQAIELAYKAMEVDVEVDDLWLRPCWEYPDWGQYAEADHAIGDCHYMTSVLRLLDGLKNNKLSLDVTEEATEFFKDVRFQEQPFGLSIITRVSYTLPENGVLDKSLPEGMTLIDLAKEAMM